MTFNSNFVWDFDTYRTNLPLDWDNDKGAAHSADTQRLRAQFDKDVLAFLGLTDHPRAAMLMEIAHKTGEEYGLEEVYATACQMAPLIQP